MSNWEPTNSALAELERQIDGLAEFAAQESRNSEYWQNRAKLAETAMQLRETNKAANLSDEGRLQLSSWGHTVNVYTVPPIGGDTGESIVLRVVPKSSGKTELDVWFSAEQWVQLKDYIDGVEAEYIPDAKIGIMESANRSSTYEQVKQIEPIGESGPELIVDTVDSQNTVNSEWLALLRKFSRDVPFASGVYINECGCLR